MMKHHLLSNYLQVYQLRGGEGLLFELEEGAYFQFGAFIEGHLFKGGCLFGGC